MSEKSTSKLQITLAVIALLGTLGGALFANWDKIFPPENIPGIVGDTETNDNAKNKKPLNIIIPKSDSTIEITIDPDTTTHITIPPSNKTQLADLTFVGWSTNPDIPKQNRQVDVRITIENKGNATASNFKVKWLAGKNFKGDNKGHIWRVNKLLPGEKKDLTYKYSGYASWYAQLYTVTSIDFENVVAESDENNNYWERKISVSK